MRSINLCLSVSRITRLGFCRRRRGGTAAPRRRSRSIEQRERVQLGVPQPRLSSWRRSAARVVAAERQQRGALPHGECVGLSELSAFARAPLLQKPSLAGKRLAFRQPADSSLFALPGFESFVRAQPLARKQQQDTPIASLARTLALCDRSQAPPLWRGRLPCLVSSYYPECARPWRELDKP